MSDSFYEFVHECDEMPDNVMFCKIGGSDTSQFTVDQYARGVVLQTTVLYGFRFCPYCGMEVDR